MLFVFANGAKKQQDVKVEGPRVAVRCDCLEVGASQVRGEVLKALHRIDDVTVVEEPARATEIVILSILPVGSQGYAIGVTYTHISHYSFGSVEEWDGGALYYTPSNLHAMEAVAGSIVGDLDAGELTHWRSH